ncbi:G-protein coupled receptor moody [Holothuria leucospilota]|uniref:G-protein coupled receptor moody n=1 Tax=Holothuria leucospilota TaxID=206669 RepID=A0A9Q0YMH3_HOLLE|nr:G-protein coupled receptor moody [Holothuria leucospilota]
MELISVTLNGSTLIPTTPEHKGYIFEDPTQRLIVAVLVCLVTLIGLPGNTLVVLAVIFTKKLQNITNVFVVNLALADLLTCLVLPFQAVSLVTGAWPLPQMVCITVAALLWTGLGTSVVNLALIAFIRYHIITRPPQHNKKIFGKIVIAILVILSWILPLCLVFFPPLVKLGSIGYSERYKMCAADGTHDYSDVYTIISVMVVELPCLVVIAVCYFKIYRYVKRTSRDVLRCARNQSRPPNPLVRPSTRSGRGGKQKGPQTALEVAVFRRRVKVAKNLFLVVCSYVICILPFGILCVIPLPSYPAIPWAMVLLMMSSCINPIIYGLRHPQFQDVFLPLLNCSWKREPERELLISRSNPRRVARYYRRDSMLSINEQK